MGLPVTIDSTNNPSTGSQNSSSPPFKSSGSSFYTILINHTTGVSLGSVQSSDNLHVVIQNGTLTETDAKAYKATDPTDSFARQDDANSPTATNTHDVYYARFNMATNLWAEITTGDRDITIDTTGSTQTADACSIAVLPTAGTIRVVYQGDSDMVQGTEYDRIDHNWSDDDGENWNGPVSVDNAGADHWRGCVIVPGSSDRVHVFFKNDDTAELFQRRINADDSLETFPSTFNSGEDGDYIIGHGVSYDDGGTQRVRCPYRQVTTSKVSIAKCDSIDTPAVTEDVDISDTAAGIDGRMSLAVDVKNLHILFQGASVDLFHDSNDDDAGWVGNDEVLDAVTINHISSNIYDRSGTKLAFVYDDLGTAKYNEIDIGIAALIPDLIMAPIQPT